MGHGISNSEGQYYLLLSLYAVSVAAIITGQQSSTCLRMRTAAKNGICRQTSYVILFTGNAATDFVEMKLNHSTLLKSKLYSKNKMFIKYI